VFVIPAQLCCYGLYTAWSWTLGLYCSEVKAGIQIKEVCSSKMLPRLKKQMAVGRWEYTEMRSITQNEEH